MEKEIRICVIGLGYVGLPLARLFSTKYPTVGYDRNPARVAELMAGHDATLEVPDELLRSALNDGFVCTSDIEAIRACNFYVVAVPTPVDSDCKPDLAPLIGASETVGRVIAQGDVVVYESTVYPGVTEQECIPVVERVSGLKYNRDFFASYSPERINPGDKQHTVEKIRKVTSGSTPEIGRLVDAVYGSVIEAGTHLAPTIRRSATSTSPSSTNFRRSSRGWASIRTMCWRPLRRSGISFRSSRGSSADTASAWIPTIWRSAPSGTATIPRSSSPGAG